VQKVTIRTLLQGGASQREIERSTGVEVALPWLDVVP